ncbi:hypothetical protein G7085_08670 [Tessaracoccus sp. HDW20]|uniref:hypothetical protein n=1 Tax=Tessaracoccus coleopterorum TaxID=2714950 RepID=UPI0018D40A32|nr:hypothetical protein [Tessaracoccus coleopterorum]NHB84661.1 hypothetical protein [Tessaracoccus coleopterorum]
MAEVDRRRHLRRAPAPTTRNGPTDAAEVHERAFELIDARGLSRDTPYIGGHIQSEAFNSRGAMVGVLELQHSGHLAAIRQRLTTIPDHFEVSGAPPAGRPSRSPSASSPRRSTSPTRRRSRRRWRR